MLPDVYQEVPLALRSCPQHNPPSEELLSGLRIHLTICIEENGDSVLVSAMFYTPCWRHFSVNLSTLWCPRSTLSLILDTSEGDE